MTHDLGSAFANAIAAKDQAGMRELLHPEIDFRAMTPKRIWEADGPDDILSAVAFWFDDGDEIEAVEAIETDRFADRQRVGYRLRVRNTEGVHLVDQQAYLSERDGQIVWMRVLCSGYRPIPLEH
jgi:hypothetical protein